MQEISLPGGDPFLNQRERLLRRTGYTEPTINTLLGTRPASAAAPAPLAAPAPILQPQPQPSHIYSMPRPQWQSMASYLPFMEQPQIPGTAGGTGTPPPGWSEYVSQMGQTQAGGPMPQYQAPQQPTMLSTQATGQQKPLIGMPSYLKQPNYLNYMTNQATRGNELIW
jgi:hypothetical protein